LARAKDLHRQVPLCDGHNDIPWCLRCIEPDGPTFQSIDLRLDHRGNKHPGPRHGGLHTDIPRLREGGVGWQFWSVYTPSTSSGPLAIQLTLEQIDLVHR
jgi:membrane dipeptidase